MLTKARPRCFGEILIEHCAPVLAGIKVANLFRHEFLADEDMVENINSWNKSFYAKGIKILMLKKFPNENTCLLYVYREKFLAEILSNINNQKFLQQRGYTNLSSLEDSLNTLGERIRKEAVFPHEIGIFLGYPLEDVIGFMVHQGRNALCCGCWKVYGDKVNAEECFYKYKVCTEIFRQRYYKGQSIFDLIVAA